MLLDPATKIHTSLTKLEEAYSDPVNAITSLGNDMKAIFNKQLNTIRQERKKKRLETKQDRSLAEQQELDAINKEHLREKQKQELVLKKSRCGCLGQDDQTILDDLNSDVNLHSNRQQQMAESI